MAPQPHQSEGKPVLAAVITVASVYVYFLIFAQFGFIQAVLAVTGATGEIIRPLMAVMGFSGIAGSVLAAWWFDATRSRRQLAAGFALGAAAAGCSLVAKTSAAFYGAAALVGLGAGLTTVTLAGMLRAAVGDRRLGLIIGLGTGLAYAFCNLPAVFAASAATQAQLALAATALGLAAGWRLVPRGSTVRAEPAEYTSGNIATWILVFLALVCLDSAAFYVIQHTPALKAGMWTGEGRLVINAGLHLGVAVLAGWALDRGWLNGTVLAGAGALLLGCALLGDSHPAAAVGLYISGVSLYSVALVFYPARSGRAGLAALVFAVAGWAGSGLGLGLAEGRADVPRWLLLGAVALIAGAMGARKLRR
jgi:hypothetical protein